PIDDAGEHEGDGSVEQAADDQSTYDADRHVSLGALAFFGRRRDRIEPDESEEDDRRSAQNAAKTIRQERMQIGSLYGMSGSKDEKENRRQLDRHHDIVGARALPYSSHQDPAQGHYDQ